MTFQRLSRICGFLSNIVLRRIWACSWNWSRRGEWHRGCGQGWLQQQQSRYGHWKQVFFAYLLKTLSTTMGTRTSPVLAVVVAQFLFCFHSQNPENMWNMRWWPYLLPNKSWWQVNVRWKVWKQSLPSLRPQGTWLRSGYFGLKLVQKTLGQIPWKTPGDIARLPYHFCRHDLGRDLGYNSRYGFRGHLGSTMEGTWERDSSDLATVKSKKPTKILAIQWEWVYFEDSTFFGNGTIPTKHELIKVIGIILMRTLSW